MSPPEVRFSLFLRVVVLYVFPSSHDDCVLYDDFGLESRMRVVLF